MPLIRSRKDSAPAWAGISPAAGSVPAHRRHPPGSHGPPWKGADAAILLTDDTLARSGDRAAATRSSSGRRRPDADRETCLMSHAPRPNNPASLNVADQGEASSLAISDGNDINMTVEDE